MSPGLAWDPPRTGLDPWPLAVPSACWGLWLITCLRVAFALEQGRGADGTIIANACVSEEPLAA